MEHEGTPNLELQMVVEGINHGYTVSWTVLKKIAI